MKQAKRKDFKNKIRTFYSNQKKYKIWQSKQFIGLLFVFFTLYFFIVSIVQVVGFTTIYSYTFGLLFGYYSYFIFAAMIYIGLTLMFNIDIRVEKYLAKKYNKILNFSWISYIFFVIGVALIIESSILTVKGKNAFPGTDIFKLSIINWWDDFTSSSNASLPNVWNSGIIVILCISFISSWAGFPVSIIIGIIMIAYFLFYCYYGSVIKIIRSSKSNKIKLKKDEIEEHKTKVLDLSFENNNQIEGNMDFVEDKDEFKKTVTIDIDDVNNIYSVNNINQEQNNEEFINNKTQEINIKNNQIQEFDIEEKLTNDRMLSNVNTFDFELNIFDTITEPIVIEEEESNKKHNKD